MKTLIILLAILFVIPSQGADSSAPQCSNLSKNERECKYDTSEYVLVKRRPKTTKKPTPAPIACPQPVKIEKEVVRTEIVETYRKNTLSLLGGYGPYDLAATGLEVRLRYKPILGLEYRYQFSPKWSVQVEGLNNSTGLIGAGYSW